MASIPRYLTVPLPNGSRISALHSLPFILVHLAAFLIFFMPFHWYDLVACLALLVVRMFFVTAGYHRYFSHRSFKTSRVFQFIIAFMAMSSSQKGVLWWAAHHRHHHRFSDQEIEVETATVLPPATERISTPSFEKKKKKTKETTDNYKKIHIFT